ncbi:MAG: 4-(cytidine 5'-diphospho)-2-C-methyl-D-erythritol kinase [Bacteroidetes bacterium]|nr:4-(cytidine 5'-diphospho)-2-C-methyl-D-erythritol kinase [Bacteroidota bacterium]
MMVFPHCKINLGLQILHQREDGFHALQTVFYPVALHDVLEIIRHPQSTQAKQEMIFTSSGKAIAGATDDNLCIKAYKLIKNDFPSLPPIQMHLHKHIPMGAGLGGGSSDGAFALQLINDTFQLNIPAAQLAAYALQLGSDCPFFLHRQPCYATGRGEILEPIELSLTDWNLVLVNPGIYVHTGKAFAMLQRSKEPILNTPDLRSIVQEHPANWKGKLINDFEAPVCVLHPEIAAIRDQLYTAGAVYASMTGSGSTVFGIFNKDAQPHFSFPAHYEIFQVAGKPFLTM